MKKDYLNPRKKLVDEVVGWLYGDDGHPSKVKETWGGARSLAHVLIVVPTAQSGRNLRLALAERAAREGGAVLSPKISMANELLVPEDVRLATEAEERAVMASVLSMCEIERYQALFPVPPVERSVDWALDLADVFLGIQAVLGEGALLMSDVKPAEDLARWRDLGELETLFIRRLEAHGVTPRCRARRAAIAAGCRLEGIEEIVLPSALDVQKAFIDYLEHSSQEVSILIHADRADAGKFDEWGRPAALFPARLGPEMIENLPTAVLEADEIARLFRAVKRDEALPALAVCDAEMYPALEGAFQNHFSDEELVLRNPSRERLVRSSLGRLLGAIIQLAGERDYETFSTLVRTGDVSRWARGVLNVSAKEVARYLGALDRVQNVHLPRNLDETIAGAAAEAEQAWRPEEREAAAGLKRLAEAVKAALDEPFVFLKNIFSTLTLDEKRPSDRELIAAAQTVRDLRTACASELVPEKFRRKLFARLLKTASYMLEPVAENLLVTTGWLEVAWCPEEELVVSGFNEGCVPENIVGHPFVPDSLRKELGLSTNASREARDAFIFAQAVACRAPGAVSVFLHQISSDKNVMKPSRILFNGISDGDLPALALRLYAVTKGQEGAPAKDLPSAWRLRLPFPPAGTVFRERLSTTGLDQYLRCPFNFYLKEVFGSHADDRNQELDAMAFGTLCHAVLERFALEGPKDSTDADEIAAFLSAEVERQIQVFGEPLPTVIQLQGEAAAARLKAFAVHQAARRRAGWRIVASERTFECRIKSCPTLLRGKVDRIDRHETTGEIAIIDYKTWRRAKAAHYNSVQLPVYRAMVEASGLFEAQAARRAKAFYCVLAERPEDVMFDEAHACLAGGQSDAEDLIVTLLTNLAKGIFYPPNPVEGKWEWQRDYGALIWQNPEEGVDEVWLADQKARREGVE